jgi:hypothetical protein
VARRFTGLFAASMVPALMLLASGCSSNSTSPEGTSTTSSAAPSATTSGAALTAQQVMPLFLQCLTDHHITIWDKAQGNTNLASIGEKQGWYKNGRVLANQALYTDADALEGFYPISPDFKPQQMIGDWVDNAVSNGTWPKVCTPLPSKS